MTFEEDVLDLAFTAGEDLFSSTVNYQYCFVKLSANNTVIHCDGASDVPIGVLQNKPSSGQAARVRVFGVSRFVIGATTSVTYGTKIGTNNVGRGIVKSANTDVFMGEVLKGGASGETGAVILHPPHTISA